MQPRMTRRRIPPTNAGVRQTLEVMGSLAREPSPLVSDIAAALRDPADPDAFPYELRGWLHRHIHQELDPYGVELIRSPEWQLRIILERGRTTGDCDDVSTLAAGLALAAGYRVRFRLLAWGRYWSHVYAEIQQPISGRWVDMDIHRPLQVAAPHREALAYPEGDHVRQHPGHL